MKPSLKDYLSIALALLAIFLCGYGIGFLLGERKGMKHHSPAPQPAPSVQSASVASWEESTLAVIQNLIELNPEQLEIVKAEIAKSSARVRGARTDAFKAYAIEYRDLNKRLQPHLTIEQQEKLRAASPD
jgi:hypothetical protein